MKSMYNIVMTIITMLLLGSASVYAATKYLARDIGYNDKNVEEALNELYEKTNCSDNIIGTVWNYPYTGEEQIFMVPCSGTYKLETWGAQGGSYNTIYIGGYGGYSSGEIHLNNLEMIYINVGGAGQSGMANENKNYGEGGYNGGGSRSGYSCSSCNYKSSSGGGATHIAKVSGLLSTLSNSIDEILIVSGGGGGNGYTDSGWNINSTNISSGGGYIGNYGNSPSNDRYGSGGTQSEGIFGKGMDCGSSSVCDGGGGGFYGGNIGTSNAGGGSGYIANSSLTSKAMYCYKCQESIDENTKTISNTCVNINPTENCSKEGNGYARITLIGKN